MEETTNNHIKSQVLQKIQEGKVHMKPKAYFMLNLILLIVVIILAMAISIFLVSYTLFNLYESGHLFLLGFGFKGLYQFLFDFPWLIMAGDALLIVFLDFLLKRFSFGYHKPIVFLFLGTFFIITLVGGVLDFTSFHQKLMYRAEDKNLPIFGSFYQNIRSSRKETGIFRGSVASIATSSFTMIHKEYDAGLDDPLTIIAPAGVDLSMIMQIGDQVIVAGNIVNGEIEAYGIMDLK